MRIRGLLLVLVIFVAACTSQQSHRAAPPDGDGWVGHIISYKKVVAPDHGLVGFLKIFRYEKEGHGPHFDLYHVYDLNFKERGIITPQGRATKFVYLPRDVARVKGKELEKVELPAQPLEWNAAKILDLTPPVVIVDATAADLKVGTTPDPEE